ncbi:ABC transporter permease subunit [Mycoplasmopsis mustelae]|nr:ABC transporter permease subunit [Mycoplasmopsis mustelae]
MWITIKSVFSGSFIGLILAFITAYFSSLNLWKRNWWTWCIRLLIILLRSLPVLIFIMIFGSAYEGQMIAFMIFWFTSWVYLHRYFCDIFESTSTQKYWMDIHQGMPRFKSFYKNIVLNNKNKFIMNSLLTLETNIRWSSILGSIGIYGIGQLFNTYPNNIEYYGISIFYIVVVIIFFELLLIFFNKYLFVASDINKPDINTPKSWKYNFKKLIKLTIFIIFLIIVIISFADISKTSANTISLRIWLQNLFNWDFSGVQENPNLYLSYWKIFQQTYIVVYVSYFLSLIYALFMSEKLYKLHFTFVFKVIVVLLKAIPVIVFFILFNSLLNKDTAIIIAVIIITFRSLTKQFSEVINRIDKSKVQLWKSLGYNNFYIYWNLLLPMYKKAIVSLVLFKSEGTFRNFITFGIFSNVVLYAYINEYIKNSEYEKIGPAFLPAFLIYAIFEILFLLYKREVFEKIKLFTTKSLLKISKWNR